MVRARRPAAHRITRSLVPSPAKKLAHEHQDLVDKAEREAGSRTGGKCSGLLSPAEDKGEGLLGADPRASGQN